jgi:hypothetical protein
MPAVTDSIKVSIQIEADKSEAVVCFKKAGR